MRKWQKSVLLQNSTALISCCLAVSACDELNPSRFDRLKSPNLTSNEARDILADTLPLEVSVAKACSLNSVKFNGPDVPITVVQDFGVREYVLRTMLVHCRVLDAESVRPRAGSLDIAIDFSQNAAPRFSGVKLTATLDGKDLFKGDVQTAELMRGNRKDPLLLHYPQAIVGALDRKLGSMGRLDFFKRVCAKDVMVIDGTAWKALEDERPIYPVMINADPSLPFDENCATDATDCLPLLQYGSQQGGNVDYVLADLGKGSATIRFWVRRAPETSSPPRGAAVCSERQEQDFAKLRVKYPELNAKQQNGLYEVQPFCGFGILAPVLTDIPLYEDINCGSGGRNCGLNVVQSWLRIDGRTTAIVSASLRGGSGAPLTSYATEDCFSAIAQSN